MIYEPVHPMVPMPTESTPSQADQRLEQACAWLARLNSGESDGADQEAASAWRSADPANEAAWRRAENLWRAMEALRGRHGLPGSRPLRGELRSVRQVPEKSFHPFRSRRVSSAWATACLLILAVALYAAYPLSRWQADYRTAKGERLVQGLSDGSKVTLNTASAIAIDFDGTTRRVRLLEGEAFFEVAKDAAHPFVVSLEVGEVVAVGTAFSVQRLAAQARVELVEGVVHVMDSRHRNSERLQPGQVAVIGPDTVQIQAPVRKENLVLWRDGVLQFDGLPLREAVEQVNRYRPGHVFLLNARLAEQRVSGVFRLDALDQAVETFTAAVPGLRKSTATPYWVLLH